jgi:site-specific recombinase XerD
LVSDPVSAALNELLPFADSLEAKTKNRSPEVAENNVARNLQGDIQNLQPLLDEVKALKLYLAERPDNGTDALFVSGKGSHLDRSAWNRVFKSIAEQAGLPAEKCHCHVLKHSLANHLVKGNVNLALIKQSLGHASIASTIAYLGTTDADAAAATRKALQDLF